MKTIEDIGNNLLGFANNLLGFAIGLLVVVVIGVIAWNVLNDRGRKWAFWALWTLAIIYFTYQSMVGSIGTSSTIRVVLTVVTCPLLGYSIYAWIVAELRSPIYFTVCGVLAIAYLVWREWPPSLAAILWTIGLAVVAIATGNHRGSEAVAAEERRERDQVDAAKNEAYKVQREHELAVIKENRKVAAEAAYQEARQRRERKEKEEQEARDVAAERREKERRQESDRQQALVASQTQAILDAQAADQSLDAETRVLRQNRILNELFSLSDGSESSPVNLANLADRVDLTPGQVFNSLTSLTEQEYARIRPVHERVEWIDQRVSLTRHGAARVHDLHTKGDQVKYDVSFQGPVGGVGIGDNPNVHDNVGAQADASAAISALMEAVRAAKLEVNADQANVLEEEAKQLETADGDDRKDVVARLYGMAKMLGSVGVPILDAAIKVKTMLGIS